MKVHRDPRNPLWSFLKGSSDLYLNFYWNRISVGSLLLILFNKGRFYFSCSDWEEGRIDRGTFQQGWHRRFEIAERAERSFSILRAEISTRYSRVLATVKDLFKCNNFSRSRKVNLHCKVTVELFALWNWFLYRWFRCFIMSSGFRNRWVILAQVPYNKTNNILVFLLLHLW